MDCLRSVKPATARADEEPDGTQETEMVRTRLLAVAICATGLGSFVAPRHVDAQEPSCGGFVFDDLDLDGVRDDTESGVGGVTVAVTDRTGRRTTTATGSDGSWNARPRAADYPVRIEFEPPAGSFPAGLGQDNGSAVQFARSADECGRGPIGAFGVYVPGAACRLSASLVTGCYLSADSPHYDDAPAIELLDSDVVDSGSVEGSTSADWLSPAPTPLATNRDIGAIYGLATDPRGTVYAAAFVKRHTRLDTRLNPLGNPTAIYRVRPGQPPELFVTIDAEAENPHDLTDDPRRDAAVFDDVYRVGLGDIDISADGSTMYVTDLGRRELVVVSLPSGRIDDRIPLTGEALGIDACGVTGREPAGDLQPFGLGFDAGGDLLLGVVCSGASTVPAGAVIDEDETPNGVLGDPEALAGYVYELVGRDFVQRLAWPLTADRGETRNNGLVSNDAVWHPWVDGVPFRDEHDVVSYPQPAITDLTVDGGGNLVVALGDRWGHQTMPASVAPTTDGRTHDVVETVSAGDLQRACPDGEGWRIEGTDGCAGGWGNGFEYFDGDSYGWHAETALGAVVAVPSTGDADRSTLIATQMNPLTGQSDPWRSGGVAWHDATTGHYVGGVRLYDGRHADPDYTFEKGSGVADLALLCDAAPLQVGGRMWYDLDADGEQDPAEPPLSDVRVELRDVDGNPLATVATDANGGYVFDDSSADQPLVEGHEYLVTIAAWNFDHGPFSRDGTHTGLRPTTRDPAVGDELDSDGRVGGDQTVVPGLTFAPVVVGDDPTTDAIEGAVDLSVDFGFRDQYDLAVATSWVRSDDVLGVLAFETVVNNQGSEPSGAFEFVNRFPFGTTLVAASRGSERTGPGGSVLRWTVGEDRQLMPGESRTYTVLVHVDDDSQSPFVNSVQIMADSGDDDDSEPGNADLDVVLAREETYLDVGLLDENGGGQTEDDADVAIVQLHRITGRVWIDPDHDARYEPDQPVETELTERAVAGVAVVLRHRDGTEIERQWTGHDGTYEFTMVPSDDYVIEIPTDEFETSHPLGGYDWMSSSYRSGRIDTAVGVRIPLSLETGSGGAHLVDVAIAHHPTRSWFGWFRVEMLIPGVVLLAVAVLLAQRHANRVAAIA